MTLVLLLLLLASPVHRPIVEKMRLSCEVAGFVDVRDFGACGRGGLNRGPFTPEEEAEAIHNAEELAKTCIPGRVLPVHYCPAKPNS